MSAHLQRLDRIFGENDPKAIEMINSGNTLGVFQLESPLIRRLIKMTEIKSIWDICLSISISRPAAGDDGKYKEFVERRLGQKQIAYPHPALEPFLKKTYGVIMFEEQIMQIGTGVAGMKPNDAREYQKCLAKNASEEEIFPFEKELVHGLWDRGYTDKEVKAILLPLRKYAGYGFCEAHAINYAYLAYYSACMKAHYPTEFMCAVLNNEGGYYGIDTYIGECRRLGIKIEPPDVNTAEIGFTVNRNPVKVEPIDTSYAESSIILPGHVDMFDLIWDFKEMIRTDFMFAEPVREDFDYQ